MVTISRPENKITKYTFFKTLRFRILVIMVLIGIIPTAVISAVIVKSFESRTIDERISVVAVHVRNITSNIILSGYLEGESSDVIERELNSVSELYGGHVRILDSDGRVIKDTYGYELGKLVFSDDAKKGFDGIESVNYAKNESRVDMTFCIKPEGSDKPVGIILASFSTLDIEQSCAVFTKQAGIITALIAVIIFIAGIVISKALVRPFRKLTGAINSVSDNYLDKPVYAPEYVESDQIAVAYNHMLSQVKAVDSSRDEFVSNVSHELKTPLASMKVLADSLIANPDTTAEVYRDFMADISEEIDRENEIIGDLMELIKIDGDAKDLKIESTNMNALLELVVKRLMPIAEKAGVSLRLECFSSVMCEIDATKIILAVSNLVENGIKYSKSENGWVHISLNADKSFCYISVSDNGIGMDENIKNHIFERFYRGDKSHSDSIKGSGLGLSIAKSAITAHKGAVSVESRPGEGSTFSVRIPLIYVV